MVSDFGGSISIVGTDDGITYWKVGGEYKDGTEGRMSIDFTAKGGPIIDAVYGDGAITWEDGNVWTKSEGENLKVMFVDAVIVSDDEDSIVGFYVDPNHFDAEEGSFAGTRMLSESEGDITLIGTDDGSDFWMVNGEDSNGEIAVDFTPKGGPVINAEYDRGIITWDDGNQWSKSTLVSL